MLGFVPFENHYKIIPVLNGLFCNKKNITVDESEKIADKLDAENKRIFFDHRHLKCKSIYFESENDNGLLIYTTSIQKHYYFSVTKIHLHYMSNLKFFHSNIRAILNIFKNHFGLCSAIYLDKRLVEKKRFILSADRAVNPPKIRSKNFIDQIDVDHLYSEIVLL